MVRAVTYADCNVLERAAFEEVCEEFPEEAVHIHAMAEERLKREATTKSRAGSVVIEQEDEERTTRSNLIAEALARERDSASQAEPNSTRTSLVASSTTEMKSPKSSHSLTSKEGTSENGQSFVMKSRKNSNKTRESVASQVASQLSKLKSREDVFGKKDTS